MNRLLFQGEWFDLVLPAAVYEVDFEEHLLSQAPHLYPSFHLFPFKVKVESEYGTARPDLVLIDKAYRNWWVVEVELGSHEFRQHVARQVAVLSTGRYTRDAAEYLARRHEFLNLKALNGMMAGAPPKVLVIVNQVKPEWVRELRRWDAGVAVVEMFRDTRNRTILRLSGDHPSSPDAFVTSCRIDPSLPKSLRLDSPAALPVESGALVSLWYEGGLTMWRRIDAGPSAWLMPVKRSPLQRNHGAFEIVRGSSESLVLNAHPMQGRRVP